MSLFGELFFGFILNFIAMVVVMGTIVLVSGLFKNKKTIKPKPNIEQEVISKPYDPLDDVMSYEYFQKWEEEKLNENITHRDNEQPRDR